MKFRNGVWVDDQGFVVENPQEKERAALRDQLAVAAMVGIMAGSDGRYMVHEAAKLAYQYADAMLIER